MDSNQSALIEQLTHDLQPVRVKSLPRLAMEYGATLWVFGGLALLALGPVDDERLRHPGTPFLLSLLAFALTVSIGSLLLAQYSRPGARFSRPARCIFWASMIAASLIELARWLLASGQAHWDHPMAMGPRCALIAVATGAFATTLLLFQLRRQAPVQMLSTALCALVSAGALGSLILQIQCANEHPMHQFFWHLAFPLGLLALSAGQISRRILRW